MPPPQNNLSVNNNLQPPHITHAITIDVEDYYHVAAFKDVINPSEWADWPSRVEANTHAILQLLDDHTVKGTFFILGWVADRYPTLVKAIANQGHEIASHGYSHQLIYGQSPEVFRQETSQSKQILEDLCQHPVEGYRAASYSITRKSLWAVDILNELGFKWDSSIFPVRHDNYGIPGTPRTAYQLTCSNGESLLEIPLTTAAIGKATIPAAGGGYFRLYPYALSRYLFKQATRENPGVFYLHPWEIDPEQPRIKEAGLFSKFRHYNNLSVCRNRLDKLIKDFDFDTMSTLIGKLDIDNLETINLKTL